MTGAATAMWSTGLTISTWILALALATTGAAAAQLAGSEWRPTEIRSIEIPAGAEIFVRFGEGGKRGVDVLGGGDTGLEGADAVEQVGHEQQVDDEAGRVLGADDDLADLLAEGAGGVAPKASNARAQHTRSPPTRRT